MAASPNVQQLVQQAMVARQAGRRDEELRLLDQALAIAPQDPRAHNARGMRALADRDYQSAIASFARAADADPHEPALRINLAAAHRAAGDREGERSSLQAALDIDQRDFMGQLRMAEWHQQDGNGSLAAYHWSAVIQLAAGFEHPTQMIADAVKRGQAFLTQHGADYADTLDREFGGALPNGADARRFRACVDHILGRRQIYRNECAGIHYPFLPADEFFDRALFPWLSGVEARTSAIRAEALRLIEHRGNLLHPYVRQAAGTPTNKWSPLDNSLEWSACFLWEYGEANEAVCALCPETAAALRLVPQNHLPGKAPSAFFSILRPGARIPPHTGVTNTRTIIHLPLVVPDGCAFRVGGETRHWREGEAFAFDDTIEHEAWNNSDQPRIVLIFDVWNPHLTPAEQGYLAKLFAVAGRDVASVKAG